MEPIAPDSNRLQTNFQKILFFLNQNYEETYFDENQNRYLHPTIKIIEKFENNINNTYANVFIN
jgi:hypothetical protein